MIRAAIITLSDKGAAGERVDESGRLIREILAGADVTVSHAEILPDEKDLIVDALTRLAGSGAIDLIITGHP